jgi:hypothetical protein
LPIAEPAAIPAATTSQVGTVSCGRPLFGDDRDRDAGGVGDGRTAGAQAVCTGLRVSVHTTSEIDNVVSGSSPVPIRARRRVSMSLVVHPGPWT